MKLKVVCSECGDDFLIDVLDEDTFDPEQCPSCGGTIVDVSTSPKGDTDVAWVE